MNNNKEISKSVVQACDQFFKVLTRDEIETFLLFTSIRDIEPKAIIAEIGDIGDEFYLVVEGEVSLLQEQEDTSEIEVGRITAGELVGEMSFFDKKPRSIRLRAAKQGVTLLSITRPMYKRLCVEHPYIAVNLLEFVVLSLDKLVRSTSEDVSTLHKQMTGIGYR